MIVAAYAGTEKSTFTSQTEGTVDLPIRFGTIRKYCSYIDRVSICMHETLCYENYPFIEDVPAAYDDLYLYGFGIIDSEFPDEQGIQLKRCIEIMLSKEPRISEGAYFKKCGYPFSSAELM